MKRTIWLRGDKSNEKWQLIMIIQSQIFASLLREEERGVGHEKSILSVLIAELECLPKYVVMFFFVVLLYTETWTAEKKCFSCTKYLIFLLIQTKYFTCFLQFTLKHENFQLQVPTVSSHKLFHTKKINTCRHISLLYVFHLCIPKHAYPYIHWNFVMLLLND